MKRNIFHATWILVTILTLILTAACNKKGDTTSPSDSQISFYNASYTLQRQVKFDDYFSRATILFDESDPNFQRNRSDTGYGMPFFGYIYSIQFPNNSYNIKQVQPWIVYMHTDAREHVINLLDTGKRRLIQTKVSTTVQTPVTVYFADSAGIFNSLVTQDDQKASDSMARLRLVHLSPDAGNIYATINKNKTGVLGNALKYLETTSYQDFMVLQRDTLRVKIYRSGDTATIIAKTTVEALPGHSYSLILSGYYQANGKYKAPDSTSTIQIKPSLQLNSIKNY